MNDSEFAAAETDYLREIGYDWHRSHARCKQCSCCVALECHGPFRDDESWQEFRLSGLCQRCQDEVFAEQEAGEEE